MNLKVIHGAPCSGKTTYVKERIGRNDLVYDYDSLTKALTYGEEHTLDRELTHPYVIGFRRQILERLKSEEGIETAWFIVTNLTNSFKEYISAMNPEYIEMEATEAECLDRLDKDDTRPDKDAWADKIKAWYAQDKPDEEAKRTVEEEKRTVKRNDLIERRFELQTRAAEVEEGKPGEMIVEGYAAKFDSPTVLFESGGLEYSEVIDRNAFDGCKMDDVIFNLNHAGRVMARTRNKTLQLNVDDVGLHIDAKLGGTAEGRSIYDDIKGGYLDRMSFRFTIAEESYNRETRTWTIRKIKRLYDVSVVDIPAYEDTSINARKADAEAEARLTQQAVDTALARQRLAVKIKLNLGD